LDALADVPLRNALSTTAGLGIVLRPREFQRIVLIRMGFRPQADEYEDSGAVFCRAEEESSVDMGKDYFLPSLARLLLPLLAIRSALGPAVERRIVLPREPLEEKVAHPTSISTQLLDKLGAAYNGYRRGVLEIVAHSQTFLGEGLDGLLKMASAPVEQVFTPLTIHYLKDAFMDELGVSSQGVLTCRSVNSTWRGATP
jgi:hypothetical protein